MIMVVIQVEQRVSTLNAKLDEMQAKKAQLEGDVDLCEKKHTRATELIGGLGGEKSRWTAVVRNLSQAYACLTGDVLLAAACIAYLGPFSATFRCASSPGCQAVGFARLPHQQL
jgi:dynein heavy chain, axonemal